MYSTRLFLDLIVVLKVCGDVVFVWFDIKQLYKHKLYQKASDYLDMKCHSLCSQFLLNLIKIRLCWSTLMSNGFNFPSEI